jgi:hypothetical protein
LESTHSNHPEGSSHRWAKLGVVASVSLLAGGLAAAWWYRKTLSNLRKTEENAKNPDFRISGNHPADEI